MLIHLPELITVLIASVDRASLTLEARILEQFYILGCIKEALVFGCFTLLLSTAGQRTFSKTHLNVVGCQFQTHEVCLKSKIRLWNVNSIVSLPIGSFDLKVLVRILAIAFSEESEEFA